MSIFSQKQYVAQYLKRQKIGNSDCPFAKAGKIIIGPKPAQASWGQYLAGPQRCTTEFGDAFRNKASGGCRMCDCSVDDSQGPVDDSQGSVDDSQGPVAGNLLPILETVNQEKWLFRTWSESTGIFQSELQSL
jgi:hypothetical protein